MSEVVEKPTREEVESLKRSWWADPEWELEHTIGFEAYHDELLAYRLAKEKEWEEERKARDIAKVEKFRNLKLHERIRINSRLEVTRVVGGWVYQSHENFEDQNGVAISCAFVPMVSSQIMDDMVNDLVRSIEAE